MQNVGVGLMSNEYTIGGLRLPPADGKTAIAAKLLGCKLFWKSICKLFAKYWRWSGTDRLKFWDQNRNSRDNCLSTETYCALFSAPSVTDCRKFGNFLSMRHLNCRSHCPKTNRTNTYFPLNIPYVLYVRSVTYDTTA